MINIPYNDKRFFDIGEEYTVSTVCNFQVMYVCFMSGWQVDSNSPLSSGLKFWTKLSTIWTCMNKMKAYI
jgi:hypothetical protein